MIELFIIVTIYMRGCHYFFIIASKAAIFFAGSSSENEGVHHPRLRPRSPALRMLTCITLLLLYYADTQPSYYCCILIIYNYVVRHKWDFLFTLWFLKYLQLPAWVTNGRNVPDCLVWIEGIRLITGYWFSKTVLSLTRCQSSSWMAVTNTIEWMEHGCDREIQYGYCWHTPSVEDLTHKKQ